MNPATDTAPSIVVVETIAAVEGVRPVDLQPPLWDVLDPGALDQLVGGDGASPSVTFDYLGHTVRIDASGDVVVDGVSTSHETRSGDEPSTGW